MSESKKGTQIWKEFEDYLAPLMGMKPGERAVYSYLVRHTRLEGRRGVVLGMPALGRGAGMGYPAARLHLFRLARHGCVAVQRYKKGSYVIRVFLPDEVLREIRPRDFAALSVQLERVSRNRVLRAAILRRERGRCFYCQQKLVRGEIWFDHIVALARGGNPEEKNVVACCKECNLSKGTRNGEEFLRQICKVGTISKGRFKKQRAAMRRILSGKHGLRKAA